MLPADWLEQLRAAYPRRAGDQGWQAVRRLIPAHIANGEAWGRILLGTANYAKHCLMTGKTGTELVKQARTFYGRDLWFAEWADADMRTPAEIAADRKWQDVEARAAAVSLQVDRSIGLQAAIDAINRAEREAQQRQWRERGLDLPKFGRVR